MSYQSKCEDKTPLKIVDGNIVFITLLLIIRQQKIH